MSHAFWKASAPMSSAIIADSTGRRCHSRQSSAPSAAPGRRRHAEGEQHQRHRRHVRVQVAEQEAEDRVLDDCPRDEPGHARRTSRRRTGWVPVRGARRLRDLDSTRNAGRRRRRCGVRARRVRTAPARHARARPPIRRPPPSVPAMSSMIDRHRRGCSQPLSAAPGASPSAPAPAPARPRPSRPRHRCTPGRGCSRSMPARRRRRSAARPGRSRSSSSSRVRPRATGRRRIFGRFEHGVEVEEVHRLLGAGDVRRLRAKRDQAEVERP